MPDSEVQQGSTKEDDLTALLAGQEAENRKIDASSCSSDEKVDRHWFVSRDPYLA